MLQIRKLFLSVIGLMMIVGIVSCVTAPKRFDIRPPVQTAGQDPTALPAATDRLSLMTWNIGYAGLGYDSDFVVDGGKRYLPPSKRAVKRNLAGIQAVLGSQDQDVVLVQELARPSLLTWWTHILAGVDEALPAYRRTFYADIYSKFYPPFLRTINGMATFNRIQSEGEEVVTLPLEAKSILPGVTRQYAMLVTRIPFTGRCESSVSGPLSRKPSLDRKKGGVKNSAEISKIWSVVNIHLSAFDEGGVLRQAQLDAILAFARREYEAGHYVIIGGDWNLILRQSDFASTTKEEFLFWVHPFPRDVIPNGWALVADETIPSVRTNERPFVDGENYRAVIDGFLVSPNVDVLSVGGLDLGFQASDHNPVLMTAQAKCHS